MTPPGYREQLLHHAPALSPILSLLPQRQRLPLPAVPGLDFAVLARALHRAVVEDGAWAPLVLLTSPAPASVLVSMASLSQDGWLASAQPISGRLPCRLLSASSEVLPLPDGAVAWIKAQDHHYLHATDPGLARALRVIRLCAGQEEVLTLIGPPGSGQRALLEAAAALSGQHLRTARAEGGGWEVLEDIQHLTPAGLQVLQERLRDKAAVVPHAGGQRPQAPALSRIVGTSPAMCAVLGEVVRWAATDRPVLILGETGSGKELIAQAIHDLSARTGSLITVDPGMLTSGLAASELFGHAAGAFSGAAGRYDGAFSRARRGSLFLDELGTLPPELQARLLRVLDSGVIQPLGSGQPRAVDARIITATNADLEQMVADGLFRADLLYRLRGATIRLPPLRERRGDIPLLCAHFLPARRLTAEAIRALQVYAWPGNVRQLRQVLENAAVIAGEGTIGARHLQEAGLPLPGPLFLTSHTPTHEPPHGLARSRFYQAMALSVAVEPLSERGRQSVRHSILTVLSGAPLTDEAMALLEGWPWWGGMVEVRRIVGLLRGQGRFIDRELILELLPQLARPTSRAPVQVLLHPTLTSGGELVGLRSAHRSAALLLGRAPDVAALRLETDARSRRRMRWLSEILEGAEAEALAFPHLPELSRAHVLITRRPDGLCLHRVPETGLSVVAGAIGKPLRAVGSGEGCMLGPAAQVQLRHGTAPVLTVWIFLEQDEQEQARLLRPLLAMPLLKATQQQDRRRVWELSGEERRLLNDAVEGWLSSSGTLGRHVLSVLQPSAGAGRLVRYIDSPEPTKYCCRLYEKASNQRLLSELRQRIGADPRRRKLPAALQKLL